MSRQRFNFWIDEDLRKGLKTVQARDGIGESEQIRRAIRKWLASKRVGMKLERARGVSAKRS